MSDEKKMSEAEIDEIHAAITEMWNKYTVTPEVMWFQTPFGCLRVSAQSAVLVDDEGCALEDQSEAAAALAYVQELASQCTEGSPPTV